MSLRLEDVSKTFGGLRAVVDVDMSASPGHVTGLIGPNGAGKTTIVNLITGILAPTNGRILFEDQDVTVLSPTEVARVGIVRTFQNVRLLLDATVLDNVALGLYRHQTSRWYAGVLGFRSARREMAAMRERAHGFLNRFGLEPFATELAGNLSYGHQRRLELARALAAQPKLLLLDEPVAGMNDVEAEELGAEFVTLARAGMAIVLVEHNMRLVSSICDEIYVLDSGRLIASGTPATALATPAVVQAYLGT